MHMPQQREVNLGTDGKLRRRSLDFVHQVTRVDAIEDTVSIGKRPNLRFPVTVGTLVLPPVRVNAVVAFFSVRRVHSHVYPDGLIGLNRVRPDAHRGLLASVEMGRCSWCLRSQMPDLHGCFSLPFCK